MKFCLAIFGIMASTTLLALEAQTTNDISWVTGGIGKEERADLQRLSPEFNVKLLFASSEGHFFGDALVEVLDASGAVLLTAEAEGPFMYVQLPAGDYSVNATAREVTKTAKLTATADGQAERRFFWDYSDPEPEMVEKEQRNSKYEVILMQDGQIKDVKSADSYEEIQRIKAEASAEANVETPATEQ